MLCDYRDNSAYIPAITVTQKILYRPTLVYMCVYLCVCVCVYICVCFCAYVFVYMPVYMCVHVCMCVYMCVNSHQSNKTPYNNSY